jgi:hypothetical protein
MKRVLSNSDLSDDDSASFKTEATPTPKRIAVLPDIEWNAIYSEFNIPENRRAYKEAGEGLDFYCSRFKCPICTQQFTNPRQFKCGHAYCSDCLESLVKALAKNGMAEGAFRTFVPCIVCKQNTPSHIYRNHSKSNYGQVNLRLFTPLLHTNAVALINQDCDTLKKALRETNMAMSQSVRDKFIAVADARRQEAELKYYALEEEHGKCAIRLQATESKIQQYEEVYQAASAACKILYNVMPVDITELGGVDLSTT